MGTAAVTETTGIRIRRMLSNDLEFAARCYEDEGWGTRVLDEFEGLLAHDPSCCFVAEEGGMPAGICMGIPYGASAFIGMLIVRQPHRGRGLGFALVKRAIDALRCGGACAILLDGVTLAVPLYERLGFRRVCRSLRFFGNVVGRADPAVRPMNEGDLARVLALDADHFGADRSYFLARRLVLYPDLCRVHVTDGVVDGFMMGRGSPQGVGVGPWLSTSGRDGALAMLESLAPAGVSIPVRAGVLTEAVGSVELMRGLGLSEREDPPWRMVWGAGPLLGMSPCLYALGSPAKG